MYLIRGGICVSMSFPIDPFHMHTRITSFHEPQGSTLRVSKSALVFPIKIRSCFTALFKTPVLIPTDLEISHGGKYERDHWCWWG